MPNAADPTYPLYPVASILAAEMLLLVTWTCFDRRSWNAGVAFLCFWLFLENLFQGTSAIVWADNADITLYVYCDIASHIQIAAGTARPMATFILVRQLHSICSLRSVDPFNKGVRRKEFFINWTLGLVIPLVVAGPLYYITQSVRFQVIEGIGCTDVVDGSILSILLIFSWDVICPLMSLILYYPRIVRTLYQQRRDFNSFLQSNNVDGAALRANINHVRLLAIASIDLLLTLPLGVVSMTLILADSQSQGALVFYPGWDREHTDWDPVSVPWAVIQAAGTAALAESTFSRWVTPTIAFAIFGLFGITAEARASYWRLLPFKLAGIERFDKNRRADRVDLALGTLEFGERPLDVEHGSFTPGFASSSLENSMPEPEGMEGSITSHIERSAVDGGMARADVVNRDGPSLRL